MIDDPQKTDRLMIMLKLSLPIQAHITRCLGKLLAEQSPDTPILGQCNVIDVVYSGDEGGIVCCLDIGGPNAGSPSRFDNPPVLQSKRSAGPRDRSLPASQNEKAETAAGARLA